MEAPSRKCQCSQAAVARCAHLAPLTVGEMQGAGLAFMKQRRMGLNDFIQKLANNSNACKHPEVQSILKISQPREPELMNANPSPPSPSQQISLVIGKGSRGKVPLARHKAEEAFYLFYHLQRERCFLEPRARFYAAQIAGALGYLHSLNINILLDSQGHIVLTDFGLCKNIEYNGTTSTFCGTPEYLAPEVFHKQLYDRTVDRWCHGTMLCGLPPFYSWNTTLQLKPNITNSGLLQKDRTKRLGTKDDITEIKNHVFSLINWDDLINKTTPPFNPNVSGASDLRRVNPEFTDELVPNSIGRSPDSILVRASVKEAAEAFLGFYAPPTASFL
uniref:Uncharacterized protein n=1 Tax=Nannospalax galili TaxID=1026970 RepID=A0A8C6RLP4_NANGA